MFFVGKKRFCKGRNCFMEGITLIIQGRNIFQGEKRSLIFPHEKKIFPLVEQKYFSLRKKDVSPRATKIFLSKRSSAWLPNLVDILDKKLAGSFAPARCSAAPHTRPWCSVRSVILRPAIGCFIIEKIFLPTVTEMMPWFLPS